MFQLIVAIGPIAGFKRPGTPGGGGYAACACIASPARRGRAVTDVRKAHMASIGRGGAVMRSASTISRTITRTIARTISNQ